MGFLSEVEMGHMHLLHKAFGRNMLVGRLAGYIAVRIVGKRRYILGLNILSPVA